MKPTPSEVKTARENAGHSQVQAAATVHAASFRTWQNWELGVSEMQEGLYELYLIKTQQIKLLAIYKNP